MNDWNNVLKVSGDHFDVQAIGLKYENSADSQVVIKVEKFAFGKNTEKAEQNNEVYTFIPQMTGNTIYLPTRLSIPSNAPYRCQNVRVTIYMPNHKTLVVTKELRKKLKYRFRANGREFNVTTNGISKDKVIHFGDHQGRITFSNDDDDEEFWDTESEIISTDDKERAREIKEEIKNSTREAKEQLKESQREAKQQIEEAKQELERNKREADRQMEEAQRKLKEANDEAQRKLEEAQRRLEEK